MPLGATWNVEFLNQNSQRAYPLAAEGNSTDQSGSFVIPRDFLVELSLPIHTGMDVDPGRFFILNVGAYATGYSIVVGYMPVGSDTAVPVATALIARQIHTRNASYALGGVSPFDDTIGNVTIGVLDAIDEQPPGFWTFDFDNTRLDPDAIRPIIKGVSGLIAVNGGVRSVTLTGDVEIAAGNNCQLVPVIVSGQDPVIVVNFVEGAGTVETCVCEGDTAPTTPISSIIGIGPTPTGDFYILGSDCINVVPITNGIQLVNTCSQPCCGCPELEKITQDLERELTERSAVQDFVNQLGVSVNTMDLIVLGARLGDAGCVTCE